MGCVFTIKIIQPDEQEDMSNKVFPEVIGDIESNKVTEEMSVDSYMIDSPVFEYKIADKEN